MLQKCSKQGIGRLVRRRAAAISWKRKVPYRPPQNATPKTLAGSRGPAECARNNANLEATAPAAEVVDAPKLNATR